MNQDQLYDFANEHLDELTKTQAKRVYELLETDQEGAFYYLQWCIKQNGMDYIHRLLDENGKEVRVF